MYNIVRTIRNITAPKLGVLTTLGVVFAALVLSLAIAGCEEITTQQGGDGTPPAPVTLSSAPGSVPNSIDITWTDPADADFSHILLYWAPGGGDQEQPLRVEKGAESTTITGLAANPYRFTAVTVDTAGNISTTSAPTRAFTDIFVPTAVTLTAAPAPNGGAEITWDDPPTSGISHVLISWMPVEDGITQPVRIAGGVETAVIPGLTEGTEYTFTAVAVDASGNQSDTSAPSAPVTADATAPAAVSNPTATPGANSSITLTWTDPVDSDFSHILISWPEGNGGDVTSPLQVASGTQTATIMNLTPGSIVFTIEAADTAGNTTSNTVTGTAAADITAPGVVTLASTVLANGSIQVTWTDPTDSDFSHILLSWAPMDGIDQPLTIVKDVETATITGLTDGTQYTFTAKSVDESDNESADSTGIMATADASGPSAVTATAAAGTNSSITLTWTDPADSDFSHIFISWPEGNGGNVTSPLRVASGVQTATVMHLTPGSIVFTIEAVDDLEHITTSTVTGTAAADITAPAVVTLTAATAAGGAEITWTDPTDFDFSHILLSWMTTGGTAESRRVNKDIETATITGLTDGAAYMFTAKSVDAAGNESAASTAASVTVDAAVPAVTNISVTAITTDAIAIVRWTDPTAADFSHVNITWEPANGDQPLRIESGVQAATLFGLTGGTQYTVTATSVDTLGNEATATATTVAATTPAVTAASATRINPAGTTTVTWTAPSDTSGIAKIAVTGLPAPTTAVDAMIGDGTVDVTGLDPNVNHTIIISNLDSSDAVTNTVVISADATLPVALFRLGGSDATHDGDFGYSACNTELAGNGDVAVAMRNAGYSTAVFFGSKHNAPAYNFIDLATDTDALGFSSTANATHLEARPVVVYTNTTPTTTFGSPPVPRTIGNVVNVANGGRWGNGGYTVVDDLTTDEFWSFTGNRISVSDHTCSNATSVSPNIFGRVGNSLSIDSTTSTNSLVKNCNLTRVVLCAAH